MNNIELLSPVADFDCLKAAVQSGADCVYFGGELFNARASANNFNDDELKRAITEAYKLPYGEKLVDILTVFINAFVKHTHRFSMLPQVEANGIPELNEKKAILLDNKELLSDTVRIN
jgi:hypothetical protein